MYDVLNDEFFNEFDRPHKIKIFYGGSGSGKSISVAQLFVQKLISGDGYNRAVFRKSFPSMKLSTYLVIKNILKDWGIPHTDHRTDHYIEVGTNRLYYLSLDDSEKIKGAEFKDVFLEEATEFDEEDFKQLRIRLSRDKHSEDVTIFLCFNPIDQNHWAVKYTEKGTTDRILVHHSTWEDNEINLSRSFIDELKSYAETDENFYRVYCLGLPGVLKNKIYNHFQIEPSEKWHWSYLKDSLKCYSIDFGFSNPTALLEIRYHEHEFYVRELLYKREMTTDDLMLWMEENKISHSDYIFADSAEPDRIEMLNTSRTVTVGNNPCFISRFNVVAANKDVSAGIDFVKGHKIHVSDDSINLIKEYNNYKYKENTKTGTVFDEPVKLFDHALDALRYGTYSLNIQCGLEDLDVEKYGHKKEIVGYSMASNEGVDVDIFGADPDIF